MKYNMRMLISGTFDVEVEANSLAEAEEKARIEVGNSNWNMMELVAINVTNYNVEIEGVTYVVR